VSGGVVYWWSNPVRGVIIVENRLRVRPAMRAEEIPILRDEGSRR